jgi:hypothetical protein
MKFYLFILQTCKLNAKSRAKIANVNAPLGGRIEQHILDTNAGKQLS